MTLFKNTFSIKQQTSMILSDSPSWHWTFQMSYFLIFFFLEWGGGFYQLWVFFFKMLLPSMSHFSENQIDILFAVCINFISLLNLTSINKHTAMFNILALWGKYHAYIDFSSIYCLHHSQSEKPSLSMSLKVA